MNETPTPPSAADFERQLFASARHDGVQEVSRRRVALALGLLPPGAAIELGAPGPRPAAPQLACAGQSKLALLSKSLLVGLAGGAIAIGVGLRASDAPSPAGPPAAPSAAAVTSVPEPSLVVANAAPEATVAAAPAAADVASAPARTEAPARAARTRRAPSARGQRAAEVASPDAESRLLDEVRLLDEARGALAAERPRAALATLARYAAEFPRGTLTLDAAVLEIRALVRADAAAQAQRLAREALSRPDSARYRSELESVAYPLARGSRAARSRH
jgi:hypothetical protein